MGGRSTTHSGERFAARRNNLVNRLQPSREQVVNRAWLAPQIGGPGQGGVAVVWLQEHGQHSHRDRGHAKRESCAANPAVNEDGGPDPEGELDHAAIFGSARRDLVTERCQTREEIVTARAGLRPRRALPEPLDQAVPRTPAAQTIVARASIRLSSPGPHRLHSPAPPRPEEPRTAGTRRAHRASPRGPRPRMHSAVAATSGFSV